MKKILHIVKNGTIYQVGAITQDEFNSVKTTADNASATASEAKAKADENEGKITTLRTDVDTISGKVDTLTAHSMTQLVQELPAIEDADLNTIYIVPSTSTGDTNIYTEYIVVNGAWEKIGEMQKDIDLTGYAKETWVTQQIANDDKTWFGTQEAYDALSNKNPKFVYYIYTETSNDANS